MLRCKSIFYNILDVSILNHCFVLEICLSNYVVQDFRNSHVIKEIFAEIIHGSVVFISGNISISSSSSIHRRSTSLVLLPPKILFVNWQIIGLILFWIFYRHKNNFSQQKKNSVLRYFYSRREILRVFAVTNKKNSRHKKCLNLTHTDFQRISIVI